MKSKSKTILKLLELSLASGYILFALSFLCLHLKSRHMSYIGITIALLIHSRICSYIEKIKVFNTKIMYISYIVLSYAIFMVLFYFIAYQNIGNMII